nr:MAG: hypothetical protein [Podoviridae sp. ctka020]
MSITLSDIVNRVTRRLKDVDDISSSIWYDIATDLNQFLYRRIKGIDPERVITSATYTVTSSPSSQALPAGFRDIQAIGCGVFYQNSAGQNTDTQLPLTGFGSTSPGYYFDGTNIVFTGINTSTVFVLRYVGTLADITAMSGIFCVPDEYKDLVTEGMVLGYYKYEEDPREADADTRFTRLLSDFLETVKKAPKVYAPSVVINANS